MSNSQKKKAAAIAHNKVFEAKQADILDRKNNPEKYEKIAAEKREAQRIARSTSRGRGRGGLGMYVAAMASMGYL
jgi:hypothetical protein